VVADDGRRFTCTVVVGGQPLTVEVIQEGDGGQLQVVPKAAVLSTAEVQADLLEELADRIDDPDAVADCGEAPVRVVAPARSFECRVEAGEAVRTVRVRVRDVDGSLTFQLR
jgi:hypothetical protein